jgi:hypothetical protein
VPLAPPLPPRPAGALLARAKHATLALSALREVTRARPTLAVPARVVRTVYRGRTVTSVFGREVSRLAWPAWRSGFYWITPGLQGASVIGTTRVGGRRLAVISGAVRGAPIWMRLAVDPESGRVASAAMLAAGHFMDSRYAPLAARARRASLS